QLVEALAQRQVGAALRVQVRGPPGGVQLQRGQEEFAFGHGGRYSKGIINVQIVSGVEAEHYHKGCRARSVTAAVNALRLLLYPPGGTMKVCRTASCWKPTTSGKRRPGSTCTSKISSTAV